MNKKKISIRKVAERFRVSKSFVQKLLKQYQQTGNIHPPTITGFGMT